jgi:hypothetical protein
MLAHGSLLFDLIADCGAVTERLMSDAAHAKHLSDVLVHSATQQVMREAVRLLANLADLGMRCYCFVSLPGPALPCLLSAHACLLSCVCAAAAAAAAVLCARVLVACSGLWGPRARRGAGKQCRR